jgi:hypothetical protein
MEGNPWVPPIADQLQIGVTHVIEYIRTDTYKLYVHLIQRHLILNNEKLYFFELLAYMDVTLKQ